MTDQVACPLCRGPMNVSTGTCNRCSIGALITKYNLTVGHSDIPSWKNIIDVVRDYEIKCACPLGLDNSREICSAMSCYRCTVDRVKSQRERLNQNESFIKGLINQLKDYLNGDC